MRNMKKFLTAVLTVCMVLSLAAPAFAAELPFTDVSASDWSYEYITYAYENGLMKGDSATTFKPQDTANRAMFATILWRVEGEPETYSENPFADLTEDWYVDPVVWAFENGVTQGTSATTFGPYEELQREQLATMLYRYVGNKGIDVSQAADLTAFPDNASVSDWAVDAMAWAVGVGLIAGDDRGGVYYLDPQGDATREQLATILTRFVKAYGAGTESNPVQMLDTELDITIGAGETKYYQGHFNGMELTVTGNAGLTVEHNDEKFEDADGIAFAELTSSNPRMPVVFSITNNTDEAQGYHISITYPVGTRENPEPLMGLAQIDCSLEEGDQDGYYYSYNCRMDGTIVLTAENYDPAKFDVVLMNSNSYAQPMMSESEDGTVSMEVASGDALIIQIVAVPDSQWNIPALDVVITGEFVAVAGTMDNPAALKLGENTAAIEAGNTMGYWYTWTAEEDGQITVTMETESGWTYMVTNVSTYYQTDTHWNDDDPVVASETLEVSAGDEIRVMVNTYDPANMWSNPDGEITITAAFAAGEVGGEDPGEDPELPPEEKEPYAVNYDVMLALGANELTMDDSVETTVFEFCPEEAGVYSFTADNADAKVGYWGAGSFFVSDQTENKTSTLTYTLTTAGPSIMVGISGVESCTLTVVREGDAEEKPTNEVRVYENTVTPEAFTLELAEGQALVDVDVTDNAADAAVLGEDGYYHLNTADGPVLLVNLNHSMSSLVTAMSYGQVKAPIYVDGELSHIVDYYAALEEYTACMDESKSVYPLTADLMQMLKDLGNSKGWYDTNVLGFYLFGNATVDPATAWMFACCYAE